MVSLQILTLPGISFRIPHLFGFSLPEKSLVGQLSPFLKLIYLFFVFKDSRKSQIFFSH